MGADAIPNSRGEVVGLIVSNSFQWSISLFFFQVLYVQPSSILFPLLPIKYTLIILYNKYKSAG